MSVEIVLAALEEYFSLKRDLGDSDNDGVELEPTRDRAVRALNAYIDLRFHTMLLQEKRKTSTVTSRIKPVNPDTSVRWEGVAAAVDALNAPPTLPTNMGDKASLDRFKSSYDRWYGDTRKRALESMLPADDISTAITVPPPPMAEVTTKVIDPFDFSFAEETFNPKKR